MHAGQGGDLEGGMAVMEGNGVATAEEEIHVVVTHLGRPLGRPGALYFVQYFTMANSARSLFLDAHTATVKRLRQVPRLSSTTLCLPNNAL